MTQVSRRHVLYIPGFDPVPPRAYRERYRREALKQAEMSGFEIAQGPAAEDRRFGWRVDAMMDGASVRADMEILYWADIVRDGMASGVARTYGQLARTAWIYIGSGALFRLMRLRKGPVIAALYPVAVLLGQALLAGMLAYAVFALGRVVLGAGWLSVLGALAGGGAAAMLLRWCARRDHLLAWYLMKDYAFAARLRGAYPPEQEVRMADFADRIAEALQGDVDEVLVVGHSSGAYMAVSVLADLIRAGRRPKDGPVLSLLTLGQVVPMVSFLPEATRLRADLAVLSVQELAWVDVTAPGDGCSFALCDPVAVSGVAPADKTGPLVISAAFTQTLSAARQKALKWRLFELHFQYLNAFDALPDRPDAYDYFRVTAGPMTLGDRFATRAPSKSRIETPVSGFTDI
ncbi:hypothetical protein [Jannaschia sp. CCS1]|uniref:hypothetical protein n=1 Tax=Jannaschia sp. (strain CCS1) TaxID=290400 RepID=UPI000053B1C7|nr:hypothetical protein [Jannaschia sp. CCS1]ABD55314.1 hypothetical protein Jann_2397 [Jannaschia sp. CCS1]